MKRLPLIAFGLVIAATSSAATASQVWMCRVAPGPLFTDVQQCNSYCVEAQGGLDPESDEPIYLCEIYRSGGGGGGGGGNGPVLPEPVHQVPDRAASVTR